MLSPDQIKRYYTQFHHTEIHRNWKCLWRKAYILETIDHRFINLNKMKRVHFHSLRRFCLEYTPVHLYMSVLNFLFPERPKEKLRLAKSYPVSGEYVANLDTNLCSASHHHYTEPEGICIGCLALSKKNTERLLPKIEENYNDVHVVFNGRTGFHIHIIDFQIRHWTHYDIADPQKSYESSHMKYTKHLQKHQPQTNDHPKYIRIEDTQRVTPFPDSLNGETVLVCSYLGQPDDFRNLTIKQILTKANSKKHITLEPNYIAARAPTLQSTVDPY